MLPELPALRLERDEHHQHKDVYEHTLTVLDQAIAQETDGPDLTLRLAALLHDIGKPATRRFEDGGGVSFHHHEVVGAKLVRKRLRALRMPKALIEDVAMLTFLHLRFHGYGTGAWTDSAVRRYVTDAGELLPRLHKLVRADCTTRNPRRRQALQRSYDDLEARIARIADGRGPGQGAPRPGRQRDHDAARGAAGTGGRQGLDVPEGTAAGARAAGPGRGRGGAAGMGGPGGHRAAGCGGCDMTDDPHELQRFVSAQDQGGALDAALAELRRGRKTGHWIWFVFPQIAGLGMSPMSQHFAITSLDEARAYLAHPVLGPRLRECAQVVADSPVRDAMSIFGGIDTQKLRSSMTLFHRADPDEPVFGTVLEKYFDGVPDAATDQRL